MFGREPGILRHRQIVADQSCHFWKVKLYNRTCSIRVRENYLIITSSSPYIPEIFYCHQTNMASQLPPRMPHVEVTCVVREVGPIQ
ncbi:hypothetical protein J6590_022786 [Homalodisca vitripennis]|nr:hypothetical protein J6590_022786 [Homalodisca vitripennis]